MPTGLFATPDQSVQVEYDGVSIPPRSTYEKNGYKPDFDKMPLEDEYKWPRRSCVMPRGPKGNSPPRADCYLQDQP
jgi:hypothetical protein